VNSRGQFSIIAALLVAVVLIGTVITTYATLRYSTSQDQPQVLSAIDETNLALEKALGFTVGYYGSVLQVTGDNSYANTLTRNYLRNALGNMTDIQPEWGASFNLVSLDLSANWFTNTSYSAGQAVIAYDLVGLGISGMSYSSSCRLDVQILNSSSSSKACLNITKDGNEPLINLGNQNFEFYRYQYSNLTWDFATPSGELTAFANGTYLIDIPPELNDTASFVVQVTDARGIMVAAASFSRLTSTLMWNTTSATAGEDYVDINTTDVDLSPNKGTQSNFTAQQYGPDLINDTLTEASTVNPPASIAKVGTDTSGTGTTLTLSFSHTLVAGSNRIIAVCFGAEHSGITVSGVTYGGNAMTLAVSAETAPSGTKYLCQVWYILEANLPANGVKTVTITATGSTTGLEVNGFCAEYSGVNQAVPEATDSDVVIGDSTANRTITSTISPSTGAYVISAVGCGNPGSYTHNASQVEVLDFYDASSQFAVAELRGANGETALSSTFNTTINRQARVAASFKSYAGTTNYRLDLEEQWTNVNYTNPRQDLCIKTGNLSSENLMVDVRSGSSWITIINPLLANQWNNVSVAQYIGSLNFTIRFRDNDSPDMVQDSWSIDAVLLRPQPALDFLSLQNSTDATITMELLQNGTMRWLGQNLNLTTQEKPVPPVPVKAIHVNQTINGVNQEVPFQIEDWASEYRIPLSLTNNATVFSNRQMIVFLVNVNVSKVTVWWNGSDTATQTPLAYTNKHFSYTFGNEQHPITLNNGILELEIDFSGDGSFKAISTLGASTATAVLMRINQDPAHYGHSQPMYAVLNGTVRAVLHHEVEWDGGISGCPNVYAHIVITLPANATYYTYQLRLIFVNSTGRPRTITDLCPIKLSTTLSSVTIQTENGTLNTSPIVATGTGTFKNSSGGTWTAHHWSQFVSGTQGAGIMFTDSTNQLLYAFDPTATVPTGSLNVSITTKTIEFSPVTQSLGQVSNFTTPNTYDITWQGAVVTFDGTTPIYQNSTGSGLWLLVEYPPKITVTSES